MLLKLQMEGIHRPQENVDKVEKGYHGIMLLKFEKEGIHRTWYCVVKVEEGRDL